MPGASQDAHVLSTHSLLPLHLSTFVSTTPLHPYTPPIRTPLFTLTHTDTGIHTLLFLPRIFLFPYTGIHTLHFPFSIHSSFYPGFFFRDSFIFTPIFIRYTTGILSTFIFISSSSSSSSTPSHFSLYFTLYPISYPQHPHIFLLLSILFLTIIIIFLLLSILFLTIIIILLLHLHPQHPHNFSLYFIILNSLLFFHYPLSYFSPSSFSFFLSSLSIFSHFPHPSSSSPSSLLTTPQLFTIFLSTLYSTFHHHPIFLNTLTFFFYSPSYFSSSSSSTP